MVSYSYKFKFPEWPIYGKRELKNLNEVLESGIWAGSRAKYINEVTNNFLELQGGEFGFPLANGTVTLETALKALDIHRGDEVIVPALTFYSTVSAVLRVNANPVIVDIDRDTYCISTKEIKKAITKKTRAIIIVHLAGSMCDMDEIKSIAQNYNVNIIEDCAHAHGSKWKEVGAGTIGEFGSFSFQHSKLISSGEGGFLIARSPEYREKAWNYSNCGRSDKNSMYSHSLIGTNNRMSDFQAAILNQQILRYKKQQELREENGLLLHSALEKISGIVPQKYDNRMTNKAYYNFIFLIDPCVYGENKRDEIVRTFDKDGIPMAYPYPPLGSLDIFSKKSCESELVDFEIKINRCPNADFISKNSIWLHHRILLSSKETIEQFIEYLKRIMENN